MSLARFRRSATPTLCSCIPKATFCIAVMCGNSEYAWNTMPISRLLAGTLVTSSPPKTTRPPSVSSRPATSRSAVVLPQPEGPSRATSSPGARVRLSPSRAVTPAYRRFRSSSRTSTPARADGRLLAPELELTTSGRLLRPCHPFPWPADERQDQQQDECEHQGRHRDGDRGAGADEALVQDRHLQVFV